MAWEGDSVCRTVGRLALVRGHTHHSLESPAYDGEPASASHRVDGEWLRRTEPHLILPMAATVPTALRRQKVAPMPCGCKTVLLHRRPTPFATQNNRLPRWDIANACTRIGMSPHRKNSILTGLLFATTATSYVGVMLWRGIGWSESSNSGKVSVKVV